MKIKLLTIFVIAASLMSACKGDGPERPSAENAFKVRFDAPASLGGSVKSGWDKGDVISVNGYLYKAEAEGVESDFLPVSTAAPEASWYVAVYPASLTITGQTISGELPSTVTYSDDIGVYPPVVQVAKSSGRSLSMRSLLAYTSVEVMSDGVSQVEYGSRGDEGICGSFTVDYSTVEPLLQVKGSGKSVRVSPAGGSFAQGTRVVIATFPRTLKSGYRIVMSFDQAHGGGLWEHASSEETALLRSSLLPLGEFWYDFGSGTGHLGVLSGIPVSIDLGSSSVSPVSKMLFSAYSEIHGGDIVPGICEQYLVNPSFETWDGTGDKGESKNELVFTGGDAPAQDADVAFPWEKRLSGAGAGVARSSSERYNTLCSQRLTAGAGDKAVLLQRVALPRYRVASYKLSFYAKAIGEVTLKASLHDARTREDVLLSNEYTPALAGGEWRRFDCELTVPASTFLFNGRYHEYNVWFELTGDGSVWIDQVNLVPSDCIDGKFNPETVAYFKEYKVQGMRWPGGNFTSAYNWKDAIGPVENRRSLKNRAWGGFDTGFAGTDEFLRFCEITGTEPIMGVAYNPSVLTAQDAADWVEYCNGSASTTWGAVRAANGHPEPYNVKYWGIGNEVYGSYQQGHTDAATYASGFNTFADKMKGVDPTIQVLASGQGVHNAFRGAYTGWNNTVSSIVGDHADMFDCHMYVYGFAAADNPGYDGATWLRVFSAAPLYLRKYISDFTELTGGKSMALLEWGVLPNISGDYPTPQRQTFANLLASACEYHEMIRRCDVVKMAAMHNFSIMVSPQRLHSEPVNARTQLYKELCALAGGYSVQVSERYIPTYAQTVNMPDVGVQGNIPEVDMVAVRKDDTLYVSCVNRNASETYKIVLTVSGASAGKISGKTYSSEFPYARSLWSGRFDYTVSPVEVQGADSVVLPPLTYTIVQIPLS